MKLKSIVFSIVVILTGCSTGTLNYATPFVEKQEYNVGYSNTLILLQTDFQRAIYRDKNIDIAPLPSKEISDIKKFNKNHYLILLKDRLGNNSDYKVNFDWDLLSKDLKDAADNISTYNESIISFSVNIYSISEKNIIIQYMKFIALRITEICDL